MVSVRRLARLMLFLDAVSDRGSVVHLPVHLGSRGDPSRARGSAAMRGRVSASITLGLGRARRDAYAVNGVIVRRRTIAAMPVRTGSGRSVHASIKAARRASESVESEGVAAPVAVTGCGVVISALFAGYSRFGAPDLKSGMAFGVIGGSNPFRTDYRCWLPVLRVGRGGCGRVTDRPSGTLLDEAGVLFPRRSVPEVVVLFDDLAWVSDEELVGAVDNAGVFVGVVEP